MILRSALHQRPTIVFQRLANFCRCCQGGAAGFEIHPPTFQLLLSGGYNPSNISVHVDHLHRIAEVETGSATTSMGMS